MKGFDKIEEKINRLIMIVVNAIKGVLSPYVPRKTISKVKDKKKSLAEKRAKSFEFIKRLTKNLKEKVLSLIAYVQSLIQKLKGIDFKSIKLSHVTTAFFAFITPATAKIKTWYFSIKPQTIALTIAGTTILTLTSINIYVESEKITRDPASEKNAQMVEELKKANALTKRATYHRKLERQFKIEGVTLPIYLGDKKFTQRVDLDITVDASNKYIKAYFDENHYYVRDMLNTQISSIDVDFPLEEEGKVVIRDKVKKELKRLLKKLKIEGEILEVHISSVFGG